MTKQILRLRVSSIHLCCNLIGTRSPDCLDYRWYQAQRLRVSMMIYGAVRDVTVEEVFVQTNCPSDMQYRQGVIPMSAEATYRNQNNTNTPAKSAILVDQVA